MIRALLTCLSLWVFAAGAMAQHAGETGLTDRLSFSVALEPEFAATKGTYVGGEIVMHVRFISSDPFKRLRLDVPVIEGVRSEVIERPHTRQIELVGDEGYSILGGKGYSHEMRLAIVPTQSGTMVIPPITVTGISEPGNVPSFEFEKVYPEQNITVHPRSLDFDGDTWIVSRNVEIEEAWSHVISEIQNGDTVRRTVKLTVAGVTADDLPELVLASNDGHRVLHTELSAETEKTEAGFVAHLEQVWDIYVETEDVTYIDEIRLPYWNPERDQTEVVAVPRQRVEPLKRDAMALREQLRDEALEEHRAERLGLLILASLPAVALVAFLALVLWRALPTRADLTLWRASKQPGATVDFYGSFLAWGRQTFGSRAAVDHEQVSSLGAAAADQVTRLHRSIFGPRGGACETKRVANAVIFGARRQSLAQFFSSLLPGISRFLFLR